MFLQIECSNPCLVLQVGLTSETGRRDDLSFTGGTMTPLVSSHLFTDDALFVTYGGSGVEAVTKLAIIVNEFPVEDLYLDDVNIAVSYYHMENGYHMFETSTPAPLNHLSRLLIVPSVTHCIMGRPDQIRVTCSSILKSNISQSAYYANNSLLNICQRNEGT